MDENIIETWTKAEYREGVSAGAAANQLCRQLGAYSYTAPTLKRLLEDMLIEANKRTFDRNQILQAFERAAPDAAAVARRESFERNNNRHSA
ncbi:hypothetical protein JL101_035820 (plasmid) [Skermanella rosea]|uniref:hypothetical protein n=1 Tax=Skermanella rosea TaxID=1817965 RepID=UPI001932DE44|nr:hypothetical protein [Skermanella rosea]UEM08021.1 hypothetical protein JL101_035820 [Skermanella rosea]